MWTPKLREIALMRVFLGSPPASVVRSEKDKVLRSDADDIPDTQVRQRSVGRPFVHCSGADFEPFRDLAHGEEPLDTAVQITRGRRDRWQQIGSKISEKIVRPQ
jgi:hypothetical protein